MQPTGINRRSWITALAASVAATACGGGGGSSPVPPPPAPPPPPPPPTAARLTLQGTQMLGPDGQPVLLKGINEGTWGEMQAGDAAMIAANGANVVRVLIRWWGLYGGNDVESRADGSPGHFKPDHLAQFLQNVQWCVDAGLWVVAAVDSNCGQNGLQNADMAAYCDPNDNYPGGHNFWTDLTQRRLFKEAWVYLAGLLKDVPRIAFYELLPEPLQDRDATYAPQVSAFYQELMAAIEDGTGDTRTPFLVGARDAYDIKLCDEAYIATPRWKDRVVYTGNLFIHPASTTSDTLANIDSRLAALTAMRDTRQVPVFVQQFGVRTGDDPGNVYLDAGLGRLNAQHVGYTGWQWRQNTPSPDEYAIVLTDPNTGADVVKTDVLAVYARYWKAG